MHTASSVATRSFISYFGGKSRLVSTLIPLIPAHKTYVEVFGGAGWLLFGKEPSRVEVLNDISKDLVTLYRVIKHHLLGFNDYLRWTLVSRAEFERLKAENVDTLTDIQRATRYYYILKNAYAGKVQHPSFNASAGHTPGLNLLRVEEELSAAHLRLTGVYIENKAYEELIAKYDTASTFFYLDPPYHGLEDVYGKGLFSRDDFATLAGILGGVQGQWLMSINDTPMIRSTFAQFNIQPVPTKYSIGKERRTGQSHELLIANYDVPL